METRDLLPQALALIDAAAARGLTVRLMGGLGFRAKLPDWRGRGGASRPDIDLVVLSSQRRALADLLTAEAYTADRQHNVLYGDRQLYFFHPGGGYAVDVVIDRLVMCHTLDLRDRLSLDEPTLTASDLLLSKLQIARLNRKDALDVLALFAAYPLTEGDAEGISLPRILAHTSSDWGWWRTLTGNLETLRQLVTHGVRGEEIGTADEDLPRLAEHLTLLRSSVDAAPKSVGWRLRSRIGERLQWYDEPEEVGHET